MSDENGIWITGASSGIGRAAAIEFAKTGSNVFLSARRAIELERLKSESGDNRENFFVYPCNVASQTNVDLTFKKIISDHKVTCLINNAGITSFKLAEDNSINEINDIINTNLLGSIYAIKAVLPYFIKNGGGTIINVLSAVVEKVFVKSSAYAASKSGLFAYSKSLREEVRNYNIRVINVIPGPTDTSMWTAEIRKKFSERMMKPETIGRIIVSSYLQRDNAVTEEILLRPQGGDL